VGDRAGIRRPCMGQLLSSLIFDPLISLFDPVGDHLLVPTYL
jgi:hypothetical protein